MPLVKFKATFDKDWFTLGEVLSDHFSSATPCFAINKCCFLDLFTITVFVLAIFLGFELISKVPATLHTPLMSGANAISGITIVGALILSNSAFNDGNPGTAAWLAFAALVLATINCVGGFMVTNRMLEMIAGKRKKKGGA